MRTAPPVILSTSDVSVLTSALQNLVNSGDQRLDPAGYEALGAKLGQLGREAFAREQAAGAVPSTQQYELLRYLRDGGFGSRSSESAAQSYLTREGHRKTITNGCEAVGWVKVFGRDSTGIVQITDEGRAARDRYEAANLKPAQ